MPSLLDRQRCNRPAVLLLHHCSPSDEAPPLCLQMGGNVTPDGLPLANRLFNVYQPFDPVAYRWVLLCKMHCGAIQTSLEGLLWVVAPPDGGASAVNLKRHTIRLQQEFAE